VDNENEIFENNSVIPEEAENVPETAEETPAETVVEEATTEATSETPEIPNKKKKKPLKIFLIVLGVIVGVALVLAIAFVAIVYHYIGMIDVVDPKVTDEIVDVIPPDDDVTDEPDSPQQDIDKIDDIINQNTGTDNGTEPSDKPSDDNTTTDNNQSGNTGTTKPNTTPKPSVPPMYDENVYNVLLIGTDSRNKTDRGRSDSMILMSINKKTEEIHMTSFMRDSYVAIPGKYNNRINAAYAYGGADLLMDTIELNYKIKIDKYVRVNFFSFMEVIDAVGGVTITVSDAEVKVMNNYIGELNTLLGKKSNDGKLSKGGTYNLTGKQALGYCRIRYVGNADFQRTQRQRDVLMKVLEKVKGMSISEMNDFLEIFLPKVTTNIPESEIFSLVMNALTYTKYPVYQHRIPADGTWWNLRVRGMAVLGMNFDKNINMLKQEIYNK